MVLGLVDVGGFLKYGGKLQTASAQRVMTRGKIVECRQARGLPAHIDTSSHDAVIAETTNKFEI